MVRRDELAKAATDYVLAHGLVGLSLRPLAEALGTSDRMLLYHFGTKDDLVTAIMRESNDRSISWLADLPQSDDARGAVLRLWDSMASTSIAACSRLYVEASALGLFGREPYADVVRQLNQEWRAALAGYFVASGTEPARADRVAALVDVAVMGLFLDTALEQADSQREVVGDLAEAAAVIAG